MTEPITQKPETRSQKPESSALCSAERAGAGPDLDLDDLDRQLRMAVGLERRVRINPATFAELIRAGCDLDLDILPTIRAKMRDGIKTLDYFADAVVEARDRRLSGPSGGGGLPLGRWRTDQAATVEALKRRRDNG